MQTQDFSTLTKKYLSFPINRAGWPFIAAAAVAAYILGHIWGFLGWLGFFATLWTVWFFRDPQRVTPTRDGLIVGAADGTVSAVDSAVPPAELGLGTAPLPRITVLRSLASVQIARVPTDATVSKAVFTEGQFHLVSLPEAEAENTRAAYVFDRTNGAKVAVVQYAGAIARDVAFDLTEGQKVVAGERFGVLRFNVEPIKQLGDKLYRRFFKGEKDALCDGTTACNLKCCLNGKNGLSSLHLRSHHLSRIDLYLPAGTTALVAAGQSIVAGETVVADLASTEAVRPFETR